MLYPYSELTIRILQIPKKNDQGNHLSFIFRISLNMWHAFPDKINYRQKLSKAFTILLIQTTCSHSTVLYIGILQKVNKLGSVVGRTGCCFLYIEKCKCYHVSFLFLNETFFYKFVRTFALFLLFLFGNNPRNYTTKLTPVVN